MCVNRLTHYKIELAKTILPQKVYGDHLGKTLEGRRSYINFRVILGHFVNYRGYL